MSEHISRQARLVQDVLSAGQYHLTAEEIQSRIPGSSTATVYRALQHLASLGRIRRLTLGQRKAVYEYARKPHMHFVCSGCGAIYDIAVDLTGIAAEAARCSGFTVVACDTTAYGLCENCSRSGN